MLQKPSEQKGIHKSALLLHIQLSNNFHGNDYFLLFQTSCKNGQRCLRHLCAKFSNDVDGTSLRVRISTDCGVQGHVIETHRIRGLRAKLGGRHCNSSYAHYTDEKYALQMQHLVTKVRSFQDSSLEAYALS